MKIIHGSNFKMHLILDDSTFLNVSNDLKNRFGEIFISDEKPLFVDDGCMIWDPGGSILGNDIKFRFKISDNFSLLCRSQHWNIFKDAILDASNKEKDGVFKLHSQLVALCMTEFQMSKLMSQIIKNRFKLDQVAELTDSRLNTPLIEQI